MKMPIVVGIVVFSADHVSGTTIIAVLSWTIYSTVVRNHSASEKSCSNNGSAMSEGKHIIYICIIYHLASPLDVAGSGDDKNRNDNNNIIMHDNIEDINKKFDNNKSGNTWVT